MTKSTWWVGALLFALLSGCTGTVTPADTAGPGGGGPGSEPGGGPSEDPSPLGEAPRPPGAGGDGVDPVTLDQATLFACVPEETTLTPQRLWRLSGDQMMRSQAAVRSSSRDLVDPFGGAVSGKTFVNYAEAFSVEEAELGTILRAGRSAALVALGDNKMPGCARGAYRDAREMGEPADPPAAVDADCRGSVIRWMMERLVRRTPTVDEVGVLDGVFAHFLSEHGVENGTVLFMTSLFGHPEALFRFEVGDPVGDGRFRLTAEELATAISLTLTNRVPVRVRTGLVDVMSDGTLVEDGVYREQLTQLMSRPEFTDVMRGFVEEYFHYSDGAELLKPMWKPQDFNGARGSLERFIDWTLAEDTRFLRNLLASTTVVGPEGQLTQDAARPGILNRQAWLVSFSDNEANDPIHRGYFIREQLLCQSIPSIPIGVVPQLPEMPDATLRERLSEHVGNEGCATCHRLMDPLGLTFEGFDHYGRPRSEEQGRPVDTSGEIVGTGTGIDGPVSDSAELVARLGSAADVERCFVRHLFRFIHGRDETYGDACTLAAAEQAYRDSDGSLRATVMSLMTSETYRYRSEGTITEESP